MSINEKVLDAIEILATNSVEKAGYDRTIQAQIISCEDATIGKYRCRYQDAIIYAYASNADITFSNGAFVYILVPGNDMQKEKTILGTTKKLGINYISQAQGDQAYDIIGNNCITSSSKFYLNTNNRDYRYTIYSYYGNKWINLNIAELNQYIKQSSSLLVGATFKTTIPPERQYRGHYGITYNLRFQDNATHQSVIRSYTVDQDNMVDNPYRLKYETRQYQIFEIDGPNFERVESIEIFNQDFPNAEENETGKLSSGDIEITSLELFGAVRMSESQINGVAISFYTPQGTFFTESSTQASYKTITAQVRVKGKLVSAVQNIPFYWGIENVGIFPSSEYYNKYLGRGWKCLNNKNIIQFATETTDPIVEWIPSKDTYILNFNEATARDNKIKVAIVYDNNVITKEINIQNLTKKVPILTIESSEGTKFYYDIGHPTLTCLVDGEQRLDYTYQWAYQDNTGILIALSETIDENENYQETFDNLEKLKNDIKNGSAFFNANAEKIEEYEAELKAFNFIQRVQNNQIYDVQISNITSFGTFKCSVYDNNNIYLGTASISLTNSLDGQDLYSLIINNGSQVFQYNENGIAPNSKSLDVQQEIQALSFTIYDNLGKPLDSAIVEKNCKIRWQFPIKDTLLIDSNEKGFSSGEDATQTYRYYDNKPNLIYNIAQKYNIKKQRNQIKLTVDYKGMNLTAQTNFTFAKQGQPGTNGTEYIIKLIPNTKMNNPPLWPMITKVGKAGSSYILNYGLNSSKNESQISIKKSYQLFKAQLWHSGDLVWEGFSINDEAIDKTTRPTSVHWEILSNKYGVNNFDSSAFQVADESTGLIQYTGNTDAPLANIIKCSLVWEGKTYYTTIPITTAEVKNEDYRVSLKDYTGFRYVIYTSDGMSPQYDSSYPFEFICNEKIDGFWEDISIIPGDKQIEYEVSAVGDYKNNASTDSIDSNLLTILTNDVYRDGCAKNQWQARPASRYDGVCVNVAICCTYKQQGSIIGKINIPIHYLLNKYGLAHINEWDGNSIQINNDGGYILSPQMGAGHKENDNSFTGVLMGQARMPDKTKVQTGLLGFSSGARTFFLNSQNGSALFGKSGNGQITIDPSSNQAMIYSGNFWKNYNSETGLPTNYNYRDNKYQPNGSNANQKGLLIDLTKPEIYFGNGHFYITKEGYVHARKGGDLGGWVIGSHGLYSNITKANGRITLDAGELNEETGEIIGPGKIYSHSHETLTTAKQGFYLSEDGLSIGTRFKVEAEKGIVYIGAYATLYGGIEGSPYNHYWTINGDGNRSYISYGGDTSFIQAADGDETGEGKPAKVYIGTDGISLGTRFSVNRNGTVTAYSGILGGWKLDKTTITANNLILNSNGSIYTKNYEKNTSGWNITSKGNAYFNAGKIGGWTIGATQLSAGKLILNSNGSISGGGWFISANGNSSFTHADNNQFRINMPGGAIFSNGTGYLGGGGGGTYASAPMSWNAGGVTLRGGTQIGFLKITNEGSLIYSNATKIAKDIIASPQVDTEFLKIGGIRLGVSSKGNLTTGQDSSGGEMTEVLSAKAIFSDGSWLKFKNGLLVDYNIVQS